MKPCMESGLPLLAEKKCIRVYCQPLFDTKAKPDGGIILVTDLDVLFYHFRKQIIGV